MPRRAATAATPLVLAAAAFALLLTVVVAGVRADCPPQPKNQLPSPVNSSQLAGTWKSSSCVLLLFESTVTIGAGGSYMVNSSSWLDGSTCSMSPDKRGPADSVVLWQGTFTIEGLEANTNTTAWSQYIYSRMMYLNQAAYSLLLASNCTDNATGTPQPLSLQINAWNNVTHVDCPSALLWPYEQCPTLYTTVELFDDGSIMTIPSFGGNDLPCSPATRATNNDEVVYYRGDVPSCHDSGAAAAAALSSAAAVAALIASALLLA